MNDQRTKLSDLAKLTVSKSDRILRDLKETVAGAQDLESGMINILRDLRSLLLFSERKLKKAKDTIATLREKIHKVLATLRVLKGLVEAAKEREQEVSEAAKAEDAENIVGGILCDVARGFDGYNKAEEGDETMSVVSSVIVGITRLTTNIITTLTRPEVGPMLGRALKMINGAIDIVTNQREVMEDGVKRIIIWRDALDVFQGDLKGGEKEDQDLFNEMKEIIEDGDVDEIYEAYNSLMDAAQNYLTQIRNVCPSCTE